MGYSPLEAGAALFPLTLVMLLLSARAGRLAQRIGRGSEAYLTTVKGMEMAMHDPRHMPVMRASYLLAPTGGDHMRQTGDRYGHRNQVGGCHFLADYDQHGRIRGAPPEQAMDLAVHAYVASYLAGRDVRD